MLKQTSNTFRAARAVGFQKCQKCQMSNMFCIALLGFALLCLAETMQSNEKESNAEQ
jgi:hypothetical protein